MYEPKTVLGWIAVVIMMLAIGYELWKARKDDC
jgi:hypothetical protein